jgi:hypothetical protein
VIAYCQGLKRSSSHLGNGADIIARFTPDDYLVFHVSESLFLIDQRADHRRPGQVEHLIMHGRPALVVRVQPFVGLYQKKIVLFLFIFFFQLRNEHPLPFVFLGFSMDKTQARLILKDAVSSQSKVVPFPTGRQALTMLLRRHSGR